MAKKYIDLQTVIDNLDTNGDELTDKNKRLEVLKDCGITQRLQEIKITPAMATVLLRLNHGNRVLPHRNMEKMKFDMTHGLWGTCESMIMFNFDGNLVNGQTRLRAVQESGIAQTFVVMTNVSPHVEMDTGTTRTPFDVITMYKIGGDGYDVIRTKKVIGAIGGMLRRKCKPGLKVENSEYCRVFDTYKDILFELCDVLNTYQGDAYVNAALVAARVGGVSVSDISNFKAAYCKAGKNTSMKDDPVDSFWNYYHDVLSAGGTDQFKERKFATTQIALAAFIDKRPMTELDYVKCPNNIWHDYDITWLNETMSGAYDSSKYRK